MARIIKRLTARRVASARPKKGRHALILADGGNLYLQATIGKGGHVRRSWLFRYELNGKRHDMGIGATHTLSLKEARDRAKGLRLNLLDNVDPLKSRDDERAAQRAASLKVLTFEKAATSYFEQHQAKWRSAKHRAQFIDSLRTFAFPLIGTIPVADIDVALVLKCIEPHWATKQVTMNRVRSRIEAVLDWATVRGYRKGDNPARWKNFLSQVLPGRAKAKHHRALPYQDISTLVAALRDRGTTAALALEFLLTTATRAGETRNAQWSEIEFKNAVWVIPPQRTKTHIEHRVPLADRCLEILRKLKRHGGSDYVFAGANGGGLTQQGLHRTMEALGHDVSTSIHGFRSTFRTWCAEQTNYPREVCEAALGHNDLIRS